MDQNIQEMQFKIDKEQNLIDTINKNIQEKQDEILRKERLIT